jgi:hypothetical protein
VQIIVYPSAIGTEPTDPDYNSYPHWCRTMLGHSAANMVGLGERGGCCSGPEQPDRASRMLWQQPLRLGMDMHRDGAM